MTTDEAREKLHEANAMIRSAVIAIETVMPTIEAFLDEDAKVDSIMPITDPTLWMNRERRATADMLRPVYRAARGLVQAHRKASEGAR